MNNYPQPDERYVLIELYEQEDDAVLTTNMPQYIKKMNRLCHENPCRAIRQSLNGINQSYVFPKEWLSIRKQRSPSYVHPRTQSLILRLAKQYIAEAEKKIKGEE